MQLVHMEEFSPAFLLFEFERLVFCCSLQNCAFVTFENDDGADCAVRCSVHEFRGKRADVKKADPKPQCAPTPLAFPPAPRL